MDQKKQQPEQQKIGTGSLRAFLRQGHKEIGQALPAFKDSIQVVEEPGTFSNPTPQQVTKQVEPELEPDR